MAKLISKLSLLKKIFNSRNSSQTPAIDSIESELNCLRAEMGLIEMKDVRKKPNK